MESNLRLLNMGHEPEILSRAMPYLIEAPQRADDNLRIFSIPDRELRAD